MDYIVTQLLKRPLSVKIKEYIGVRHRIEPMVDSKQREDDQREDPLSANESVARLRLRLNHKSLLELEEDGVVSWDRDNNIVEEGPNFARPGKKLTDRGDCGRYLCHLY